MARLRLFELIDKVGGPHSGNVFYSDTDSLYCNRKAYEILKNAGEINEKELGKLKVEVKCTSENCIE